MNCLVILLGRRESWAKPPVETSKKYRGTINSCSVKDEITSFYIRALHGTSCHAVSTLVSVKEKHTKVTGNRMISVSRSSLSWWDIRCFEEGRLRSSRRHLHIPLGGQARICPHRWWCQLPYVGLPLPHRCAQGYCLRTYRGASHMQERYSRLHLNIFRFELADFPLTFPPAITNQARIHLSQLFMVLVITPLKEDTP